MFLIVVFEMLEQSSLLCQNLREETRALGTFSRNLKGGELQLFPMVDRGFKISHLSSLYIIIGGFGICMHEISISLVCTEAPGNYAFRFQRGWKRDDSFG